MYDDTTACDTSLLPKTFDQTQDANTWHNQEDLQYEDLNEDEREFANLKYSMGRRLK